MRLHRLMDGEVVARVDWRELPDLDDLALDVLAEIASDAFDAHDGMMLDEWADDEPTRIAWGGAARVDWRRTSPCWCGEHGWHMDRLAPGDAERPLRAFLAIEWGTFVEDEYEVSTSALRGRS